MNEVRSPEQIEREINELRAQISDTLDAVQHKLSPGELLDQALGYAKDGGAVAANIGRGMRDNPIPATLFGISLAWLWYSGSRGARTDERRSDGIDSVQMRTARENLESERPHDAQPDNGPLHDVREKLESARSNILEARDASVGYVRNNPIAVAAAALTAGTLIGAFLPRRRR
jgi:ElaB/YqjD/DUF883 family membrane-anchored ribosome-binding protein